VNELLRRVRLWIEAIGENRAGVWDHVAGWAVAWLVLIVIIAIARRDLPPLGVLPLIIAVSLVSGFASYWWQRVAPRLRSWASSPRNIGKAVVAVAVVAALGALWWRFGSSLASVMHHPATARYPGTSRVIRQGCRCRKPSAMSLPSCW
jgi:hypothetical protein